MDLNRLRVFHAVFRARSVARAALSLHVTSSAVSQALRALEDEVGTKLFQRQPRGLAPTPHAEELAKLYSRFSGDLDACLSAWRETGQEPRGTLRIGAPPEFGAHQVVTTINNFSANKRALFTIDFGSPEPILSRLVAGELDLAFCDSLPTLRRFRSAIVTEPIFLEKSVLVCSQVFYKREVAGDLSFSHLSQLDHVDYLPDGGIMQLWYQHHFGRRAPGLRLRLVAHDVQAMIVAVVGGLGLAFVPEHLVADHLRKARLVVIGTRKKDYINPIVLARLKDHVPSLLERKFIEQIRLPHESLHS